MEITMPTSPDYRALLDEKFSNIHTAIDLQFTNVNDKLNRIEAQVTKTNGRVTTIESKELNHVINCPQTKRLDKLEEDLADYNFFKRNPKLSLGIIVVSVIIVLFSYVEIKNIISNGVGIHDNGIKIEAQK